MHISERPTPRKSKIFFHVHTSYTDGELSVGEYFDIAKKYHIQQIIFLEHIRHKPSYNVNMFINEILQAEEIYGIQGVVGFEAKILPSGELDIAPEHIEHASYIGIAEHAFPNDAELLLHAFQNVIKSYPSKYPNVRFVWVHPGLWFKKRFVYYHPVLTEMYKAIVQVDALIERNFKYQLPSNKAIDIVGGSKIIEGIDAHTRMDIEKYVSTRYTK
ncbi:MAG: hypothetical protein GXN93_05200 [Candidatus Diapherotrites archaeon]|nr:hypothetical protein [Candidatus Diapherotrites archaeon]